MNKEYFKNTNDIIGRSDHKLLIDNKSYFDTVQKITMILLIILNQMLI